MNQTLGILFAVVLALGASTANAQQAEGRSRALGELALSNDTMQLRYVSSDHEVGSFRGQVSGAFFLSEERDIVLSAGMTVPMDWNSGPLSISIGPRVYAALLQEENSDVMAISLGTDVRLSLNRRSGLAVAGHAYYAPDILTFGSADNLTDLGARVEINATPRMIAFAGMRWFEFDLTNGGGTRTLQEELFGGFGYRF
jgi:hypothetical protein